MARKTLISAAWLAAAITTVSFAPAVSAGDTPRAVLELFTSQGCSSCPPADQMLGELIEDEGILAVTLPVQLWDFLGWRDTLANQQNTDRQLAYSIARGDRDVYTPQMIVNGTEGVVASDRAAVEEAIAANSGELVLPMDVVVDNGILSVTVDHAEGDLPEEVTLWLMVVEDVVEVPIGAGENRGRKLTYHNVVREMRPIGMWKGKPLRLDLPLTDLQKSASYGCVVIAQEHTFRGPGRIIGAAAVDKLFPARAIATAE